MTSQIGRPAPAGGTEEVGGYPLRLDRWYDPDTHMWVESVDDERVRLGLDALTADTYGALAQLAFTAVGTPVGRGEQFGSLEAAKFVGPLLAPVSGLVAAVNRAVLEDPELVLRDPYGAGWLVELVPTGGEQETARLVSGDDALSWFGQEVIAHRERGLVAE